MKLIDFDGMFDEKLAEYMGQHGSEFTEKQWEEKIPKLYKKFGDTFIKSAGNTPNGYYAALSDAELCKTLVAHVKEDVPVSDFLCRELERRNCPDELIALLGSDDEQVLALAVNIAGGNERAFPAYLDLLTGDCDAETKDSVCDQIKTNADPVLEKALAYFNDGIEREYMMEILSRCKTRDDRIFAVLTEAIKTSDDLPMHASYLAAYGDGRALPILYDLIDRADINFLEYQELKYAIEALGGEYTKPRDFTNDAYYQEICAQSQMMPDFTEEKK